MGDDERFRFMIIGTAALYAVISINDHYKEKKDLENKILAPYMSQLDNELLVKSDINGDGLDDLVVRFNSGGGNLILYKTTEGYQVNNPKKE